MKQFNNQNCIAPLNDMKKTLSNNLTFQKNFILNLNNIIEFISSGINDLIPLLIITCLFLALVYKIKFADLVEGFIKGVKKAVVPAGIVILVYVGLVIVTFHGYQLSVYDSILGLSVGSFVSPPTPS